MPSAGNVDFLSLSTNQLNPGGKMTGRARRTFLSQDLVTRLTRLGSWRLRRSNRAVRMYFMAALTVDDG